MNLLKGLALFSSILLLIGFFGLICISDDIKKVIKQNTQLREDFTKLHSIITYEDSSQVREYRLIVVPVKGKELP